MSQKQEDFIKLYNNILEKYEDEFAIIFNDAEYPTQKQSDKCLQAKDELFTDFYVIKKLDDSYELLECAYYEFYDYFNTSNFYIPDFLDYEVLKTQEYESIYDIVKIMSTGYIDVQEEYDENFDLQNYTLINGFYYKATDLIIASNENKGLLLEAYVRMIKESNK
jgi:hypothetical protein